METNACGVHTSLVSNVLRDETEEEEIKIFSCFYSNQLLLSLSVLIGSPVIFLLLFTVFTCFRFSFP